jgi:hypothetical protein
MASIESNSKARRRTKSLTMKTSSSTSLVNKASKISSWIITRDGFAYFPTANG